MKYYSFILTLFILLPYQAVTQVESKGKPVFNAAKGIEIPVIILPEVNIRELKREDKKHNQSKLKSLRFAKMIDVDISPEYDGVWESDAKGNKIWYVKIKSPGAFSLSILFDQYRLPIGSQLFVYSTDHMQVRGSFTYKNNKWNNMLPVAPVKGDEVIIEYQEPYNVEFKGEIHISSIAHDYKNVFDYLIKDTKAFGGSGSCNININCDNDEIWQMLKHSVCKITYNGWLCSGALINNTKQDGYPYFLTANHCIHKQSDASAAIFYFNYESPTCENIDGVKDQTIAGSTIIATPKDTSLDFSLLELSVVPPPVYEPYYAGWNRDVADPESVTTIHHPNGDIKKITKSYDGATTGNYIDPVWDFNEYTHWWIDRWDEGTTEGGSSGAPLFDQNGRIIGDLTGGDASCSYNYNDYFQQLSHAWQDFSDTSLQLKRWLDPVNAGMVWINGYLPYDTIPSHLTASLGDTLVNLSWNEVIDTANIEYYYIYRNNIKLDSVKLARYSDTLVMPDILYKYYVTAKYKQPLEYESLPSNTAFARYMNKQGLPYVETFEDRDSIPDFWYEERSNDTVGWQFKTGGFEGVLDTAFEGTIDAYFYDDKGETSKLILPRFDFSAYTNLKLRFYLYMQEFNNDVHHLNILYKNADTTEWKTLRTFDTNISKWEKKEVSLPNLSDEYQIALEGVGLRGSGICIDSVSIVEDGKFLEPEFSVNKDTICLYDSIEFSTSLDNTYGLYWDFGSTATPKDASGVGPFWVKYSSSGIKPVKLIVNDTYVKYDNDIAVVYNAPEHPSFTNNGNELTSDSDYGNQWYLNNAPIRGATEKTYVIKEEGNYAVEVTNSFGCSAISENQYMVLNDIEQFEDENITNRVITVYPNPNNGKFSVQIKGMKGQGQYSYKIIDISGKVVQSGIIEFISDTQNIDLMHPTEGIYFIQICSKENNYTSKLLIKK